VIHTFSPDWYQYIVSQKYPLRSLTQVSSRVWGGGQRPSLPHTQLFLTDITFAPMRDPILGDIDSFFSRLRGRSGVVRIADAMRLAPWYDRNLTPGRQDWSDGSTFTDGSGFASGYLPPEVFVVEAAARGARYLVLGGFPVSTANVLRRGDPFEIKPNGIRATFPHRYKPMLGGSSDASGYVGIEIEPGLRAAVAAGDTVGLRNAASVFHMTGDDQFDFTGEGAGIGNGGGSLVEALDLVP
jgi:hypothetical protein